ncbi:MAG: ATP-grasp domain-containing protein [Bacilli bacterium]|nr:ATP-grasp domain-containing protein [Bacilli bacterium]
MKKGVIILNQDQSINAHKLKRFLSESKKLAIKLDYVINDGTLAYINEFAEPKINLPRYDFVIYLDKDYYLARLLEEAGYRLFTNANFMRLCDDKFLTYLACLDKKIRMPKTFASPLVYTKRLNQSYYAFLNKVGHELGYPLIVKKVSGSLGLEVYLVKNKQELLSLYRKLLPTSLIFQCYIKSSKGRSVRVLIIDGQVFGAIERYHPSDFRSNAKGAKSKAFNNPKYLAFAQMIAKKLNIDYAGIDLLFGSKNEPILCEINSNAFFNEFEKVTKKNAAAAYLKMVLKKIK